MVVLTGDTHRNFARIFLFNLSSKPSPFQGKGAAEGGG